MTEAWFDDKILSDKTWEEFTKEVLREYRSAPDRISVQLFLEWQKNNKCKSHGPIVSDINEIEMVNSCTRCSNL